MIKLSILLPEGHVVAQGSPTKASVFTEEGGLIKSYEIIEEEFTLRVDSPVGSGGLYVGLVIRCCRDDEGLRLVEDVLFQVPVDIDSVNSDLFLEYDIE